MNLKKISLAFFAVVTTVSVTVFATAQSSSRLTLAETCQHEGNHYTKLSPTDTVDGTQEFWVCCKCHKHFIEQVDGIWNEAGVAPLLTDYTDDRYLFSNGHKYTSDEMAYIENKCTELGFELNSSTTKVKVYKYHGDSEVLIIPEGVTSVGQFCFKASQGATGMDKVKKIVIPTTLTFGGTALPGDAFSDFNSSVELYFVNKNKNSAKFTPNPVYKELNVDWVYRNGEPFAK